MNFESIVARVKGYRIVDIQRSDDEFIVVIDNGSKKRSIRFSAEPVGDTNSRPVMQVDNLIEIIGAK